MFRISFITTFRNVSLFQARAISHIKKAKASQTKSTPMKAREIKPCNTFGNIGEEISGRKLDKQEIINQLNVFYQDIHIRELAKTHDVNHDLFDRVFTSFRRYCYKSDSLSPDLHVKFCDIISGHGHVSDLFPYFLTHAREAFPHLECLEELRKISNLGQPHTWYPTARAKSRKVFYHAGPTNSGKTYHAMLRFLKAKSGVYCGPLKLLANEIFHKANNQNVPCDLVTGEEVKIINTDGITRAEHISCTVEMASLTRMVEVAIIDEIQMLRDPSRGWAWTKALLGIPADEIHLCGEEAALEVVRKILLPTADVLEVVHYKRLTPLVVEDNALDDLKNVRPGDCIVCFNKDTIYSVSVALQKLGHSVAVVYGTLPPSTKLAQCEKFNKLDLCKIMVATDAIGMGLNLSIGRVIFYSVMKSVYHETHGLKKDYISASQCLQIAGRAGRFNTAHSTGYVTTLRQEDLKELKRIMSTKVEPIERAGLHPTAEQMELFAFHLPHLSLCNLIDLFVELCEYDSSAYFICDLETFKTLADMIEHIKIPLIPRFVLCCAPINVKSPFLMAMFTKFARYYQLNEPVTGDWLRRTIGAWRVPNNLDELNHLEAVFDVCELYLWLSYRFPLIFSQVKEVREIQRQTEVLIYTGITNIVKLIKAFPEKAKPNVDKFSVNKITLK